MEHYTLQTEKVKTNILKKDVKGVKICNSCRRELNEWMNECHVYRRQMLWSHLKHCSGSHALSEMQQSVGVQTTWGVHLPNQRWSILRFDKGTECELWTQKGSSSLAVTIKFFYYEDSFVMTHAWPCLCYSRHFAGAPREIDNTTDLQRWGGAYGWPENIPWLIIITFKCYKLFASKLKWMGKKSPWRSCSGFYSVSS